MTCPTLRALRSSRVFKIEKPRRCPRSTQERAYTCPACKQEIVLDGKQQYGHHDEARCPECGAHCCFTCDYVYGDLPCPMI